MKETVEKVRATSDSASSTSGYLCRPSDKALGIFPCRTFNVDTQSISWPHTDQGNLAQGWCSITPLGNFNPVTGGHLVLWSLGLVIEFPPGCTALIPSSIVCHSNTSLKPGEVRHCIVQYASGRLFRWVDNGFMTDKALQEQIGPGSPEDQRRREGQRRRWCDALASFSTLDKFLV